MVDNAGGRERFLSPDCNVRRTLARLTQAERAGMPRLHFFAGEAGGAFAEFLNRFARRGARVDLRQLPVGEDGWDRLDCAVEAVLGQYEEGARAWRYLRHSKPRKAVRKP